MNFTTRQRRVVLGVMLIATLVATAVSSNEAVDDGVVRPALKVTGVDIRADAATPVVMAKLDLGRLARDPDEMAAVDVFAPKSWAPPPAQTVPVVALPVVPSVPPLPFRYVGQLGDAEGHLIVYLARGETVYTVRAGDILDEQYRLDALEEEQLTLTYLPMNQQQTLAIPPR